MEVLGLVLLQELGEFLRLGVADLHDVAAAEVDGVGVQGAFRIGPGPFDEVDALDVDPAFPDLVKRGVHLHGPSLCVVTLYAYFASDRNTSRASFAAAVSGYDYFRRVDSAQSSKSSLEMLRAFMCGIVDRFVSFISYRPTAS